jgi:hypothetical protein
MRSVGQRLLAVALLLTIVVVQAVAAPSGQLQCIVKTKHLIQPHEKVTRSIWGEGPYSFGTPTELQAQIELGLPPNRGGYLTP